MLMTHQGNLKLYRRVMIILALNYLGKIILALDYLDKIMLALDYVGKISLALDYLGKTTLNLDYLGKISLTLDYLGKSILALDYLGKTTLALDNLDQISRIAYRTGKQKMHVRLNFSADKQIYIVYCRPYLRGEGRSLWLDCVYIHMRLRHLYLPAASPTSHGC